MTFDIEPRGTWGKEDFVQVGGDIRKLALDESGNVFTYTAGEDTGVQPFVLPPLSDIQTSGIFAHRFESNEHIDASGGFGLTLEGRLLAIDAAGTRYEIAANVADFSIGNEHMLYVTNDGRVFGFGKQTSGALGNGVSDGFWASGVEATMPGGVRFTDIQAGADVSFAIAEDGSLWGWGHFQGSTPKRIPTDRAISTVSTSQGYWHYSTAKAVLVDELGRAFILTVDPNGASIRSIDIPGGASAETAAMSDGPSAVVVADGAAYYVGSDGGAATAEPRVQPSDVDLVSLSVYGSRDSGGSVPLTVGAVGSDGRLYHWSSDGGFAGQVNPSPVSSVLFGGVEAEIVTANDSSVTVRTPAHASGVVDVALSFRALAGGAPQEVRPSAFQFGDAPKVLTHPSDALVSAGDQVSFTADASGDETPLIRWEVGEPGGSWGAVVGGDQKTLSFTASAGMNSRLYRAVFTNALGGVTTMAAKLTIIADEASDDVALIAPGAQSNSVGDVVELPIEAGVVGNADAELTFTATGLPAGLTIDPSTGLISGSVTEAGSWATTVTAVDLRGTWNSVSFDWTVSVVVDLAHEGSVFSVSAGDRVAGEETHSVLVTLADANGEPAADRSQFLEGAVDAENMTVTGFVEKSAGNYEAQVHAATAGAAAVSVRYEGQELRASGESSVTFIVPSDTLAIDRLAGDDRFAAAVAISREGFPDQENLRVPVVYVSTGMNFPDALSAAPAAVADGGPLLLTTPGAVPEVVVDEITRLNPERIVVVGGINSVSDAAVGQLRALAPTERIDGADRFAASRNIVRNAFDSADVVYLATGYNFPDALSASAAGGAIGAPVILVPGADAAIDAETAALIRDLGASEIRIAGGVNSVSEGIEASLSEFDSVTRLSGTDRFEAAAAINRDAFETSDRAFMATGFNFPDALAGAALAGAGAAPLYLSQTDCVPASVVDEIERIGANRLTLLGGKNSLSESVESLTVCG